MFCMLGMQQWPPYGVVSHLPQSQEDPLNITPAGSKSADMWVGRDGQRLLAYYSFVLNNLVAV